METTEREYIIPREKITGMAITQVSKVVVESVLDFLKESVGQAFKSMGSCSFTTDALYKYMKEALDDGRAKVLCKLYDGFNEMGYVSIPGAKKLGPEDVFYGFSANKVVLLEEFNLVFVTVSTFGSAFELRGGMYIFAPSNDNVYEFNIMLREYQKEHENTTITEVTDISSGSTTSYRKREGDVSRDDVLIEDKVKTEIFRMIDQFFENDGSFYKDNNIPYKRGLLMYGPPGNGKTTLIKSLINSVKFPICIWQVTEFTNSEKIKDLFMKVRDSERPTILIIEDLDSLPQAARSTFLNTLDGVSSNTGVFIIGTTNFPDKVDPALLNRAGRFDRTFEITKPDATKRELYLNKLGVRKFITDDEEFKLLIKETDGLSMVTLGEIYTSIAIASHYDGKADIRKILKDIKDIGNKQAKGIFNSEKTTSAIGFSVAVGD